VLLCGPWLSWGRAGTAVALDLLAVGALVLEAGPVVTGVRTGGGPVADATRTGSGIDRWLWALATVEALAVLPVAGRPSWWTPVVLAVATAVPLRITTRSGRAGWVWASVPLALGTWLSGAWLLASSWGAVPARAPGTLALAGLLAPLPAALVVVALALRRRHPTWSPPAYAAAAVLGGAVLGLTLEARALTWVATELLVIWIVVGGLSTIEGVGAAVPAGTAAGMAGAAVAARLLVIGPAPALVPHLPDRSSLVAVVAMAVLVVVLVEYGIGTLLGSRSPGAGRAGTAAAHRWSALAGAGAVVLVTLLALPATVHRGGAGAALVAVAVAAALLAAERGWARGAWWFGYAAVAVASLGALPLAALSGATDPQWYVVVPGLVLLGIGIRLGDDRRDPGRVGHGRWVTAAGAAVLLVTTFAQSVAGGRRSGSSLVVLVAEGAAVVLAGVCFERRVPVVAGAAAVALGGLAALSLVPSTLALSLLIGAVAVGVLAIATLMVAGHRRTATGPAAVRSTAWRRWR
jgi:hypothetical protein